MRALHFPRSRTTWPQGLPPSLALPTATGTPPTISTTAFSAPTLARLWTAATGSGSYRLSSTPGGGLFTYSRSVPGGTNIAVTPSLTITAGLAPQNGAGLLQASFFHDGANLEIGIQAATSGILIRVDDKLLALNGAELESAVVAAPGSWFKLAFGSRAIRRIDVIGGNFIGVRTDGTDAIYPAPVRGPRVICLGDSFSQPEVNKWHSWMGHALGWDDVWAAGVGGTGYLATNGGASLKFRDRVAADVIAYAPDIVMVCGSLNDAGASPAAIQSEAALLVAQIRAALPNCLVIGGYNARGGVEKMTANALDVMDATAAGFVQAGGVWLNPIEMPIAFHGGAAPSVALASAHAAGRVGANPNAAPYNAGTASQGLYANMATGSTPNLPQAGQVLEIGSGATRERIVATGFNALTGTTGGYWFQGALQYAHASGEPVTMKGPSCLTGSGRVGATTGWGNADLYVTTDGTHPTVAGHKALGMVQAALLRQHLAQLK